MPISAVIQNNNYSKENHDINTKLNLKITMN